MYYYLIKLLQLINTLTCILKKWNTIYMIRILGSFQEIHRSEKS